MLTATNKLTSEAEERVREIVERLWKTPAIEHTHARKDTQSRDYQPKVPLDCTSNDRRSNVFARKIDDHRAGFDRSQGIPCHEAASHHSDEELNKFESESVLLVQAYETFLVLVMDGSLAEHGGDA